MCLNVNVSIRTCMRKRIRLCVVYMCERVYVYKRFTHKSARDKSALSKARPQKRAHKSAFVKSAHVKSAPLKARRQKRAVKNARCSNMMY